MPLVILCGYPSSGKSSRCEELSTFLREKADRAVHVVGDHGVGVEKNEVYADSKQEKDVRGKLKAAAQRLLTKDDVVILDSLNYIKGYRYELYCISKSANTTHCVIHCDTNRDKAHEWNQVRDAKDRYKEDIFNALLVRFEAPNPRQRWDSPLFFVQVGDELPCQTIYDALFLRKAPPPNLSTQSQPLSSTNFLYELDRITQDIVKIIVERQKTGIAGDQISIPGAKEKIDFVRPLTLMELQRYKRQFITYTKMHPVDDVSVLPNLFVQYLQTSIK